VRLPERALGQVLSVDIADETVHPERDYAIAGVYGFGRGLFHRGPIRGDETSYTKLHRLTSGRLVMSRLKAFEGAIAVITPEFDGWYLSPEFPTFTIDATVADERYIANLCAWPELWARLSARSKGVGARKVRVSAKALLTIKVPLPDLDEQRRIAARLDSAYRTLEAVEYAQSRAAVLRAALTDRLLSDSGPETRLGEFLIPSADFIEVVPNGAYNIVGILSHGRGLFMRPTIQGSATSYNRYNKIHKGQFVYSRLFGWEGALAIVEPEFEGFYMSHEFPSFAVRESRADPSYVAHLVRWPKLHDSLRDKGTGMGSRRQRVSPERLLATTVPLPDLPTQRRIVGLLNKVDESSRMAEKQASTTQNLRSALLATAFDGRL